MKTNLVRLVLPLAALAFVAAGTASAQTAIPGGAHSATYVISKPGSYYLSGNRTTTDGSVSNIRITAADVTLDLRGFILSGGVQGVTIPSTENVEIRNGTIANVSTGVDTDGGSGLRLIDLRVVSTDSVGIESAAEGTQIDRCHVSDAGEHGIYTNGAGSLITDCVVVNSGAGITVSEGSKVVRSTVRGGTRAIFLGKYSMAQDCVVSGASTHGVIVTAYATLRDSLVIKNNVGVSVGSTSALIGTRISQNTTNIQGTYINGGGNVLQ